MLSRRANVSPSATLAVAAKVREMKAAGREIFDFSIGEPDFATPENISRAGIGAIEKGFTKYTAASGIAPLKQAICRKLKEENGLDYSESQIVVSCGAKHSLYNIFLALLDDGDEVIIPSPYWTSYPEQVKIAGGKPVFVETDENFHINADHVAEKITSKTKAIIINSPNNPSGAVLDKQEMKATAETAGGRWIISDEIYENFVYGRKHHSIAEFAKENTVVVNGVSKTFAMTGWRIGYCAAPKEIAKAVSDMQSQMTGNPSSISQMAALEALRSGSGVAEMVKEFDRRRKFMTKRITECGLDMKEPEGAFYAFPEVPHGTNSIRFADLLLEKGVACVPGKDFGSDRHVRFSYAASMKDIEKGMERLEKVMKNIA